MIRVGLITSWPPERCGVASNSAIAYDDEIVCPNAAPGAVLTEVGTVSVDDLCENDVFYYGQQFATTDLPEGTQLTGAQSNLTRRACKAHPAAFPVRIPEMFITHLSDEGAIVGEPFCGAGSTMCACEKLGRICYGMEIEPKYVSVALQRMQDMGLTPRLVESASKSLSRVPRRGRASKESGHSQHRIEVQDEKPKV